MASVQSSFGIAINKCGVFPNRIKCFKINSDYYIFIWCQSKLSICEYKFHERGSVGIQELIEFTNPIVDIINIKRKVLVFDIYGCVYEVEVTSSSDKFSSDDDLFDSPMLQHLQQWKHKILDTLENCEKLLAVSSLVDGFITVLNSSNRLEARVYNSQPLQRIFSCEIAETVADKVVLTVIDAPSHWELREHHLPFLSEDELLFPLIGTQNGEVHSFSICKKPSQSSFVTWMLEPAVNFECVKEQWSFLDEKKEVCAAVLILTKSGSVTVLCKNSTRMLFLSSPVCTSLACQKQAFLVTSDGIDCILTKLTIDEKNIKQESSISPVKGIDSLCCVPNFDNLILAGTKHFCIYWLDTSVAPVGDPFDFEMPEDNLMKALLASAKYLGEASEESEKEDSKLMAINIATRGTLLSKFFNILVMVNSGDDRLKIRIENECDFVTFTPDIWRLFVSLTSEDSSKETSFQYCLKQPFKNESPLVVEILCSVNIDCVLSCEMIGILENNQPLLCVPLGKVTLDAGFFLSPIKNIVAFLERTAKKESVSIFQKPVSESYQDTVLDFNVGDKIPLNKIFKTIFHNSVHRMSKSQWNNLSDENLSTVKAAVGKDFVEIKLDRGTNSIKITSREAKLCYSVRDAVLTRLRTSSAVIDQQVYIDFENIKQSFDLEVLKPEWNLKAIQDLKNLLRSKISGNLCG